jgi:6-carboxyhexanoate--CoA ligase
MRASRNRRAESQHLSGAERLVEDDNLAIVVAEMLARGRAKNPEGIKISIDLVPISQCHHVHCLPVHTIHTGDQEQADIFALHLLTKAGVAPDVGHAALDALHCGLGASGHALRGASLWNMKTGRRLEANPERGVRTSRFDYSAVGAQTVDGALAVFGLTHFRTREALAVATKTLWSGVSAELCWSDEHGYATGYVATPANGYVRLPGFKPSGAKGGRIFFVDEDSVVLTDLVERLEKQYVLIVPPIVVNEPVSSEEFLDKT